MQKEKRKNTPEKNTFNNLNVISCTINNPLVFSIYIIITGIKLKQYYKTLHRWDVRENEKEKKKPT